MLPKIKNELTHTFKIGDEIFTIRPWKTKDERQILLKTSLNEGSEIKEREDLLFIDGLILPCVLSGDPEKLSTEGIKRLFIEVKMISTGDDSIDIGYDCIGCGKKNELKVQLNESLKYKPFDTSFKKINEITSIKFKPIPFREVANITDSDSTDKEYEFLLNSIDKIEYEDTIYDEFTLEELQDFIDELPSDTFVTMVNSLIECKDSVVIETDSECVFCKEENHIVLDGENDFLEF